MARQGLRSTRELEKFYKRCINATPDKDQIMKCVEECNELAVVLQHYIQGKEPLVAVQHEIADVLNMAEMMREIFNPAGVDVIREEKLQRWGACLDELEGQKE